MADERNKRILAVLGVLVVISIIIAIATTRRDPAVPTEAVPAGANPVHRASDEPDLPAATP